MTKRSLTNKQIIFLIGSVQHAQSSLIPKLMTLNMWFF